MLNQVCVEKVDVFIAAKSLPKTALSRFCKPTKLFALRILIHFLLEMTNCMHNDIVLVMRMHLLCYL